ncbi:hypothetical protein P4C99_21425 [Pontiellaceae bacterium B1224]|nr:hypothetical protein [Pontiellaceae bacterium B1224]
MKKLFDIWKKGWCVVGRLYLFIFFSMLITIPFRLLPKRTYSIFDDEGFHLEGLLMLSIGLIIAPLIFYCASRLSREFIVPRKVQNQWLEDLENNK